MDSESHGNKTPDLSDPRYLDEVGYFLYYEKEMRWDFPDYDEERRSYSKLHLQEVLEAAGESGDWIRNKRVLNIGSGCSCAVMAWNCRSKVSVDPLIDVYSRLGMLLDDDPDTPQTLFVTASAEELPLSTAAFDLTYCRNALDHMHHPEAAIEEIARVTGPGGYLYLDVDLEGDPTPDEPSSLSEAEVMSWVEPWFDVRSKEVGLKPFSINSRGRMRVFLERGRNPYFEALDKQALYDSYLSRIEKEKSS